MAQHSGQQPRLSSQLKVDQMPATQGGSLLWLLLLMKRGEGHGKRERERIFVILNA